MKNEENKEKYFLDLICEVEDAYVNNFEEQAKLFKDFFYKLSDDDRIKKVKDFISKQTPATRWEVIKEVIDGKEKNEDILYLGIPGSLGRSFGKVNDQVAELLNIITNPDKDILAELMKNEMIQVNATTTSIMYLFFPEKFIPIAGPILPLLHKLDIATDKKKINNWDEYSKILEDLKGKVKLKDKEGKECDFKPSFTIAFSFTSWLMENQIDNILNKFLEDSKDKPKNIILTGIPGTGKTFAVEEYVKDKECDYEFVQFHPSYDYEDFIEGLKPVPSKTNSQIEFKLVDGIFKKLCKRAFESKDKNKKFVMIIDEINRANLSRVFGELLYCLEYRDEFVSTKMTSYIQGLDDNDQKLYSIDKNHIGKFSIPSNVIILGTMNEVDRSIDAFDLALRRRFIWEDIGFSETALRLYKPFFTNNFQIHIEDLIKKAKTLNDTLGGSEKNKKDSNLYIGANYKLGHTYYFKIIDYYDGDYDSALCNLWDYHLNSIVREYCKIKFGENELSDKLEKYKEIIVGKLDCNG